MCAMLRRILYENVQLGSIHVSDILRDVDSDKTVKVSVGFELKRVIANEPGSWAVLCHSRPRSSQDLTAHGLRPHEERTYWTYNS